MENWVHALPCVSIFLWAGFWVLYVCRPRVLERLVPFDLPLMVPAVIRLAFAGAWVIIGVGLLFRQWLFSPEVFEGRDPRFLDMGGVLALVLAGFNVLRWRQATRRVRRRPPPNPLSPRERPTRPAEYNPELDFTKRDGE